MTRSYPCVKVDLNKLRNNMTQAISRCQAAGVTVCGVIKGCNGIPEVAKLYRECGATQLASSRIEQIKICREAGIPGPYLLLRVPGMSELPNLVECVDISLQSERSVLDATEKECVRQNKTHGVVIMADLGDLREGFWDYEEMVDVCCHVENDLPHVKLLGIGVNLGCYGSIRPTPEKMHDLLDIARRVEGRIGRKLEIVSGGATSTYVLVNEGSLPEGINHLRIGEGVLNAHDLWADWGITDMEYFRRGTFTLCAEVLEVKEKPSYPYGERVTDAFGNRPEYVDVGNQIRALVGFGRADVGAVESLTCKEPGMTVIGGSSDHCIVNATNCRKLQPGDILEFELSYSHMLYATDRSDMPIRIVAE